MNRTARKIAALAVMFAVAAPAGLAQADPNTNIQKPGHVAISISAG
jgi:hypothetical protein